MTTASTRRGLEILHTIATEVAGPEGEVWTVAPAFEQSGVGHCISYVHPTMIAELGPRRFAAEGSPADCVLAALSDVLAETPPDLVLSGVNRGNNAAENVLLLRHRGRRDGGRDPGPAGHRAQPVFRPR